MLYKTNVALAIKGNRVEPGTEVELTPEAAARYGDDLSPATGEPVEPEVEVEEVPLEEMTLDQLKAKAKALGLKATGSKADLIERISLAPEVEVEDEDLSEDN